MELFDIALLAGSFFGLLALGVPVAYAIGLATGVTLLANMPAEPALATVAQRMATGLDSFTLLAIPFFILAGQLMNKGGIAARLIDAAKAVVGALPGGLAFVNIVSSMLFGAISGSAVAAASAIGTSLGPRMEAEGYDRDYAAAVNITAATTGLIIPPSNVLIVYSLASGGVSIAALFLAGYGPGLVVGGLLMAVAAAIAMKRGYPTDARLPLAAVARAFWRAVPSLLLLVVVIGGIVGGLFTATEAAAVAVVYALALAFAYREVGWRDLPQILLDAASTTAVVMLLIATSLAMSWAMAYVNLPQGVTAALAAVESPLAVLLFINVVLLVV
ncbi:MAG: TRAP transporter large permease, partial [Bacteroidota bacterium]